MKSLSRARLLVTPWTAAHQAPPSMGFSRQDHWSGVPLPSPHYYQYILNYIFSNREVSLHPQVFMSVVLIISYYFHNHSYFSSAYKLFQRAFECCQIKIFVYLFEIEVLFYFFFLLRYSGFTILCPSLLHSKVIQLYASILFQYSFPL